MILDRVENLSRYASVLPHAIEAAAVLAAGDPANAPFEVRVKHYATKDDGARRFEVHDRTIDLMVCLHGKEVIHVCPSEILTPAEPLPDGRKLDGGPCGTAALLEAGWFIALYPGEAHMVGGHPGAPDEIDKWVMKLPC